MWNECTSKLAVNKAIFSMPLISLLKIVKYKSFIVEIKISKLIIEKKFLLHKYVGVMKNFRVILLQRWKQTTDF